MKHLTFASILLGFSIFMSCDDNTGEMGTSLISKMDELNISTDTFYVKSRSVVADSVYARNAIGYLGKVLDPETGGYVTGDFMSQFHVLEDYRFPEESKMTSRIGDAIVADSCELRLYFDSFFGDSLTAMKLTAYEMGTPMSEGVKYYSDFDPIAEGLVRADGIQVDKTYNLTGTNIRILLNDSCWDKEGNGYNNFGTYLLQSYYKNPNNFKNSYRFINNVVPGFYFKSTAGLGSMAYITRTQLNVFFRYAEGDTTYVGTSSFAGTEEVLQTTHITNTKSCIDSLVTKDESCTYIKSPAGIFTELELPVDEIINGRGASAVTHENDTINSAKLVLQCLNNTTGSDYALPSPTRLLMLPADSLYSFFEKGNIVDYRTSFLSAATSSSSIGNTYTFNNINGLITFMHANRGSENWNKVVLVPVKVTTNSNSQIMSVVHDMSLSSVKLVRGYGAAEVEAGANSHAPLKISIIYSKFE